MRLVHQEHQVVQLGEVFEIAFANVLAEPLDARAPAAPDLRVDLADIEDVDVDADFPKQVGLPHAPAAFVVVAGDNLRRVVGELGDALKNILWGVRREIREQLVVDGQVRRQDEEVRDAFGLVEVGDKGAHEARLADARRKREAQGREVALEIRDSGEFCSYRRERLGRVGALFERDNLTDPVENLQRLPLRLTETEPVADGVDSGLHDSAPPDSASKSAIWSRARRAARLPLPDGMRAGSAGAIWGRFATFRL